jgi:DNA-binding beta-propeller fold protein YncE
MYFTDGGGTSGGHLYSCPLAGCSGAPTAILSGMNYATRVSFDSSSGNVAVTDDNNGNVVILTAGGVSSATSCGGSCFAIATDGSYFYISNYSGASRLPVGGGTLTGVWTTSPPNYPEGLGLDSMTGRVWVVDQARANNLQAIASCLPDGSGCTTWPFAPGGYAIHVARSIPYVLSYNYPTSIYACASASDCSAPTAVADASSQEFTFDANYLYFYNSNLGGIARCALGTRCGSNPGLLASAAYATDIKNDANYVYWITSAGAVWRVAK